MKALVLAAGVGGRLYPITKVYPKCLVPVNGKPILMKQLDNLVSNGIFDITVVAGYKADMLERVVHEKYPEVKIVVSEDYETTNNMYSAYLGILSMFPEGVIGPFFMMNADVFFDDTIIQSLKEDARENLIVVDIGTYNEESMKVSENNGWITKISKTISVDKALGCSIDIYKFGAEGAKAFFKHIDDYINRKCELKYWSEVALNDALQDVAFHACPANGRWVEIDDQNDLAQAQILFGS